MDVDDFVKTVRLLERLLKLSLEHANATMGLIDQERLESATRRVDDAFNAMVAHTGLSEWEARVLFTRYTMARGIRGILFGAWEETQ